MLRRSSSLLVGGIGCTRKRIVSKGTDFETEHYDVNFAEELELVSSNKQTRGITLQY